MAAGVRRGAGVDSVVADVEHRGEGLVVEGVGVEAFQGAVVLVASPGEAAAVSREVVVGLAVAEEDEGWGMGERR